MRPLALSVLMLVLAGCMVPPDPTASIPEPRIVFADLVDAVVTGEMTFTPNAIRVANEYGFRDLGEPTIEVSSEGTIYVAGHVFGAVSTGTPAFVSRDDGETWTPLPFWSTLRTPAPGQGSAPPPGDEGFIVAGEDGEAWMVDINVAAFPVVGWCRDGAEQCYYNPNAYDHVAARSSGCGVDRLGTDRPWAAYGNGTLLLVNNPGGHVVQIGSLKVPPAGPIGVSASWNMCAGENNWVPGVPGLRDDGFFAVPQILRPSETIAEGRMYVITGNVRDLGDVTHVDVFDVTSQSGGSGAENFGHAKFDQEGTMYVAAINNTAPPISSFPPGVPVSVGSSVAPIEGRFRIATSIDDGASFATLTVNTSKPVRFFFVDGNRWGPGALVTWSLGEGAADDWFAAHIRADPMGRPVFEDVSFVGRTEGSGGHVIGSSLGPDGRAYLVTMDTSNESAPALNTPLRVWVQDRGTKPLPISSATNP